MADRPNEVGEESATGERLCTFTNDAGRNSEKEPAASSAKLPVMKSLATTIERKERRAVRMLGHAVREDGSIFDLTVVDLSYDGCGIECFVELAPGEKIKLGVVRRGAIIAIVRWCSAGQAGLVFTPEPEADGGPISRQVKRVTVDATVSVRRQGRHSYRVRVSDASTHGCRIEFADKPQTTESLRITFDGLAPMEARVRWVDERRAGLAFSNPIHPAVFELVAERLRQGP